MNRLTPRFDRTILGPVASTVAVATLLLLQGCANENALVDVGFGTQSEMPSEDVPPDPDEAGEPTPEETAAPTPTPDDDDDDDGDPEPTPAPTPSLACGIVVIRDLRIDDESSGADIRHRAWADLDLTNPDGSTLNALAVSPGTYDRVRFTMHKRTGDGSGGPGTGNPEVNHSIHLCGTWNGIAWDYTDDTTDTVDRRDAGGVVIDGDGPAKLFVAFDSSTWFDGIDLTQATVAPDGVVYLAHHENDALQRALRENIKKSVHLANELYH